MSDNSSRRDPGSPIARLTEAEKQLGLVIHDLQTESEHVDPEPLSQLEGALDDVREVADELDAQAREAEADGGAE